MTDPHKAPTNDKVNKRALIIDAAFRTMLDTTPDMVFVKDAELIYTAASTPFAEMVGKTSADDIVGRSDFEIFEDEGLAVRYTSDDRKLFAGGEHLVNYIEPIPDDHGRARYGSTSKYILRDADGSIIGVMGITRDITRSYMAMQHHERELKYLFELPADAYAAIFIDATEWRIIGERRNSVRGCDIPICDTMDQFALISIDGIADHPSEAYTFYTDLSPDTVLAIYDSGRRDIVMDYRRKMNDDKLRWVRDDIKLITDPANGNLCAMILVRDIELEKQAELELIQAAEKDELTGLLNRASTMKAIRDYLDGEGSHGVHALFMIDIDNFKEVNDTFGHQAGDKFLTALAMGIKRCFRDSDIVGRIGGDEFFALMKNAPNMTVVRKKADMLLEAMRASCGIYGVESSSGSIGISIFGNYCPSLESLYAEADRALYTAKRRGKNQFAFATEPV